MIFGKSEMAHRIRAHDWSTTSLGPIESWPQSLKTAVDMMLASDHAMQLAWGSERTILYNDACAPMLSGRHPNALGIPFREAWPDIWEEIEPLVARVFVGDTVRYDNMPLVMMRTGYAEETWWNCSYSPVRDESGAVAGLLNVTVDATPRMHAKRAEKVLIEEFRYTKILQDLSARLVTEQNIQTIYEEILSAAMEITRSRAGTVQILDPESEELVVIATRGFSLRTQRYFHRIDASSNTSCGLALRSGDRTYLDFDSASMDVSERLHVDDGVLSAQSSPLMSRSGRPIGMVSTHWGELAHRPSDHELRFLDLLARQAADLIEQRQAEAALRDNESRLRLANEAAELGVFEWDPSNDSVSWENDRMFEIFGRSREAGALTAATFMADVVHPDDAERFKTELEASLTSGQLHHTGRFYRADGALRWVMFSGKVEYAEDGTPLRMPGVTADVTERKIAEVALRDSEARYQALFAASPVPFMVLEPNPPDFTITAANDAYLAATLTTREGLIGRRLFDVFTDDPNRPGEHGSDALALSLDRVLTLRRTDAMPRVRYDIITPSGAFAPHWWLAINAPMLDATGNVTAIIHQVTRVTELHLAEEAERQAQEALRESEARFQQFAKASAAGLWIREANTLAMEFVSPAIATMYGVKAEALLGDVKRWASTIVPDDRDLALKHLEEACRGEIAVHEFRIQRPSDGAFRWIRNTEFPLQDNGHIPRIGGIAEDVTEAKLAVEHQGVLLAELQHRVRNIMAIIRSIAERSGERAGSVHEYAEVLAGRLLALSRVQALLTRTANVSVSLRSIVADEVSVQAQHEGQYEIDGPDIDISPKAAEVLTLALHELATNALKYGALSAPNGKVTVRWEIIDKRGTPWLSLDWTEQGAPKQLEPQPVKPRHQGFGSELIEGRIPYELKGRGRLRIEAGRAQCHLEFPLKAGPSILETGAPQRATVFGGALDMTGEPDLSGRRILVVEDDYYLATDAARALRGAGAEVQGPCSTEEEAREKLAEQRPDAVLLDINLGPGPTFKVAETLNDSGIPFVFVTGYDQNIIPAEFDDVERLEKPVQLRRLVSAVAKLLSGPTNARGREETRSGYGAP